MLGGQEMTPGHILLGERNDSGFRLTHFSSLFWLLFCEVERERWAALAKREGAGSYRKREKFPYLQKKNNFSNEALEEGHC